MFQGDTRPMLFQGNTSGLTFTVTVSKDGAAFAAAAGAVTGVSGSTDWYKLTPGAADTTGAMTAIFKLVASNGTVYTTGNIELSRVYSPAVIGTPNLATLIGWLRSRLNDVDEGNYTDTELIDAINTAYAEMQVLAKSYITSTSPTVVSGTSTYSFSPIFEPLVVLINGVAIPMRSLADLLAADPIALTSTGVPTRWVRMNGKEILLSPIPTGSSLPTVTVYGFGVSGPLTADTDAPTALPVGFDTTTLLDRAEAEARKMRLSYANNAVIVSRLLDAYKDNMARFDAAMGSRG